MCIYMYMCHLHIQGTPLTSLYHCYPLSNVQSSLNYIAVYQSFLFPLDDGLEHMVMNVTYVIDLTILDPPAQPVLQLPCIECIGNSLG